MSTPLVSGAIAAMLEKDPYLTNVEIKMLLKESAEDLGLPQNVQGWGLFNREKFLKL
jgi:serine protease AprX